MGLNNSPIKAAIFDIGATLVTGPPIAPNKVIAALMDGVSASEVSSVIMTTDLGSAREVCSALECRFGKLSEHAIKGIVDLWDSQSSAAQEIEGATGCVLALKDMGLKIGLLSDIWNPYYASVEKALPQVVNIADAIVLSCRSGVRKPNCDNFHCVLSDLGIKPYEAVMIGDTYTHDILPALELGMKAVWVLARPEREADWIIKILNDESPSPTATVMQITDVTSLEVWPGFKAECNCKI